MFQLRDYQIRSQEILSQDSSGLDASELGTGKTLTGVERVRTVFAETKKVPYVLVVAPPNTHGQWARMFATQFPALKNSPRLRIISTPHADPESWNDFLLKKKEGIYIIGWEAMRGVCPKQISIIKEEAQKRIAAAREERRELKRIIRLKRTSEHERQAALKRLPECEKMLKILPGETATTKGMPPKGWVPKDPSGARRGYGALYKGGANLTKAAVRAAIKEGDVPPWTRTGTWDLVIVDESHRMARRTSINKLALSLLKADRKLAMSGTPAGNRPEGIWSTLNWLWPKQYSAFWTWAGLYMEIEDERAGNTMVQKIVGEKNPGQTWLDIPCKVRHRVQDVRDQLPDVIERVVEVEMGEEQRRIYEEFADRSLAWIDDHPVGEPIPLTQRIRLRQAALGTLAVTATDPDVELGFKVTGAQPKLDMVKDILADLPENEPVVIYTHSKKWVDMAVTSLEKSFPGGVFAWTGSQSRTRRDQVKDHEFGRSIRIIVAQLQAIAEGTDGLQKYGCCEIWASPTEDGIINTQAQGRLHRDGQNRLVQRWILNSSGTIDVGLDLSLRLRRQQMKEFYRDKGK
jgi:hypothetical protein